MRSQGFELIRTVTPTTGAAKKATVGTYTDKGDKFSLVTFTYGNSLAARLAQAYVPYLIRENMEFILACAFNTDDFELTDTVFRMAAGIVEDEPATVIRFLSDSTDLTYISHEMPESDYDGFHAQIIGEFFNKKGTHKGFKIHIWDDDMGIDQIIHVASTRRAVAVREYGFSPLYGTFVKKALATQALQEAQDLTKSVNTANCYHHVDYKLHRCDVGTAS